MGVSRVLIWRDNPGAVAGHRPFDGLTSTIESLKGGSRRRFAASVALLKVAKDPEKGAVAANDLWKVDFADRPAHTYMVLRGVKQAIEADSGVSAILGQATQYQPRLRTVVEGAQYQLGDFAVRVGSIVLSGSHRGTMLQVEFKASSCISDVADLLQEFVAVLTEATATSSGSLQAVEVPLHQYALPVHFTPQHLAVLYCSMVTQALAA